MINHDFFDTVLNWASKSTYPIIQFLNSGNSSVEKSSSQEKCYFYKYFSQ